MAREPKSPVTVQQIKEEDLYGIAMQARGEGKPIPDTKILQTLFSAEDFYERALEFTWRTRRVFADAYTRQEGTFPADSPAKLPDDFDENRDIDEPAYDYDTSFFGEDRWGELQLSHRPVRRVLKYFFAYPGTTPIYVVPKTWVKLDRKHGQMQLIPADGTAVFATFNAYVMSTLAGGRGMPQSIFVDYEVGFTAEQLEADHQDLLEGLRLRTMLGVMGIASTVASGGKTGGSLSLDGLSRSQSFGGKYGAYAGQIQLAIDREQEIRDSWKRAEKGVPMVIA